MEHFTDVDCQNPDAVFSSLVPVQCKAEAGDMIFVPDGWYHNVLTTPATPSCRSIGINLWYRQKDAKTGAPDELGSERDL